MKQYFVIYDTWDDYELNWVCDYRVYSSYDEAHNFKESLRGANYQKIMGPLIKAEESIDKPKN